MIKPYYKHKHTANVVEVEDFGVINLSDIPIKVRLEEEGYFEIGWALTYEDGKEVYILSECGGRNALSFGGRRLGVLHEIK